MACILGRGHGFPPFQPICKRTSWPSKANIDKFASGNENGRSKESGETLPLGLCNGPPDVHSSNSTGSGGEELPEV